METRSEDGHGAGAPLEAEAWAGRVGGALLPGRRSIQRGRYIVADPSRTDSSALFPRGTEAVAVVAWTAESEWRPWPKLFVRSLDGVRRLGLFPQPFADPSMRYSARSERELKPKIAKNCGTMAAAKQNFNNAVFCTGVWRTVRGILGMRFSPTLFATCSREFHARLWKADSSGRHAAWTTTPTSPYVARYSRCRPNNRRQEKQAVSRWVAEKRSARPPRSDILYVLGCSGQGRLQPADGSVDRARGGMRFRVSHPASCTAGALLGYHSHCSSQWHSPMSSLHSLPKSMAAITITILHGADRGRVFRDLRPPVTVGREEGNSIQLNDERVSRCHLKIQEDNNRIVLTDLDSTNGTKVNGQESHLRILRSGDLIAIGRSLLLIGRASGSTATAGQEDGELDPTVARELADMDRSSACDFDVFPTANEAVATVAPAARLPGLPENLTPSQAAQISELLDAVHGQLKRLIESAVIQEGDPQVHLAHAHWLELVQLQSLLAETLRRIGNPE